MPVTPTDDQPGFLAEAREHCHDCYRLIRPGQTYFLTVQQSFACPDRVRAADAIRLAVGLAVEVRQDSLLLRRGNAVVEVFPYEVRHLVDALVEAAEHRLWLPRVHQEPTEVKMIVPLEES